jgi:sulfopyruvate decarboxylase subunit alpha
MLDGAPRVVEGLVDGGVRLVAHVPDTNLDRLILLCEVAPELQIVALAREEEGVGVCTGAFLGGSLSALIMQNAGLLNSCNGLVTTAIQHEIPMLLLVWYAGDLGDSTFQRLGEATEPVLRGLGIRYYVLREPERVRRDVARAARLAVSAQRPIACLLTRDIMEDEA